MMVLGSFESSHSPLADDPTCKRFWARILGPKPTSPPDDCPVKRGESAKKKGSSRDVQTTKRRDSSVKESEPNESKIKRHHGIKCRSVSV